MFYSTLKRCPFSFKGLLLLVVMLFTATSSAQQTSYPLTVTDPLGHQLTIESKPVRISSKMLFTDELLLELVEPARLSSLTNLANDPTFSNVSEKVPSGVSLLDMNVEQIIANQPDIVFAANWTDAGKVSQLRKAGIKVYLIETPFTLEEIQKQIIVVGDIIGESERATQVVNKMNHKLTHNLIEPDQTKTALDYNSWGSSSTKNSTWHSVLTQAHVTNMVADYEADQFGQAKMSKEMVIQLNPQLLFIPGWIYGDTNAASKFKAQVSKDPALSMVEAVKSNNVISIPERLRGTYSQYIVDTILYVNKAAYGAAGDSQ